MPRPVTTHDMRIDLRVLHAGPDDDGDVLDPEKRQQGRILKYGHPGMVDYIAGPGLNHVVVRFLGLEDEGISHVVGFDHDSAGTYPGLSLPDDAEWHDAVAGGWWSPRSPE